MKYRVKVTAELDRARAKAVRKALRDLPPQFRGRQIVNAQKKIMKPAKDEVLRVLKSELNTTSLDTRSVQVVQGKYAKKRSPYVVVQTADKAKMARRFRERYSASHQTNWWRIDHLVAMGTQRSIRKAGRRTRAAEAGRDRVRILDANGNSAYTQLSATSGRYFLVQGPNGLHPIKKIKHPGTSPTYHYDRALAKTGTSARNKFYDYVASEIVDYKRKKGLK